jgi:hypothetical protein
MTDELCNYHAYRQSVGHAPPSADTCGHCQYAIDQAAKKFQENYDEAMRNWNAMPKYKPGKKQKKEVVNPA